MRDGDFELITLRSGSRAVRHVVHGEVMHPAGGPWQEANRLYVEQPQLAQRLMQQPDAPVRIFDVGLGAATNAVAALTCAKTFGGQLEIHSFELDLAPLRLALRDAEGFPFLTPFHQAAQALMTHGEWSAPGIRWVLHHGDFLSCLSHAPHDAELVFYDPFSPQHNAELWTPSAFSQVRSHCKSDGNGALLITYSAATPMRVSLLLGGFFVGAGASTGTKQETTVAQTMCERLVHPLGARWLSRWERSSARAPIGQATLSDEDEAAVRCHPQFS